MTIDQQYQSLLKGYLGAGKSLDEIWTAKADLQPHWAKLLKRINKMGLTELGVRQEEIHRLLAEAGVTYNIYQQNEEKERPWNLDPIPFLIAAHDWEELERGVCQRASLMNLVYKDLYGERKLLRDGIIPPEMIFLDHHFLRACDQLPFTTDLVLRNYAVDISRSPDGQLWVIGDRTQAPSGLAYAMENRVTMARVLPEWFNKTRVKKIAPFYRTFRENLINAASVQSANPMVVLLSPGPYNATYFEHTYMAFLQGFQLVQGHDLLVKDNYVWLKTLSGLEKVDVIIRHVDDTFSDPLALRPDSQLGVAGLLEVARRGNVTLANPLGTGVLENPGLMAFMPAIARYFLDEDLLLPNIASWWCGHEKERNYVLKHMDELVIKDIQKRRGRRTVFGWELSAEEKAELTERIKAFPNRFVGQEQAIFSTAPALSDGFLEPRSTVLRCYASASAEEYTVLPGGLTRSAPNSGNSHVSNESGGMGKDTWVLSPHKEKPIRYNPKNDFSTISYEGLDDLPSRMAENIFWLGRYLTRVRMTARFFRIVLKCMVEIDNFDENTDKELLPILLKALTHTTMTYPGFVGEGAEALLENPEEELKKLLTDEYYVGGLAQSVKMLRNAANAVRNFWSPDTWRIIDQMDKDWEKWCKTNSSDFRAGRAALDQLINNLAAIQGFTLGSLSIEEGRPVFNLGLHIEKSLLTISLFRSTLTMRIADYLEDAILEALLVTCESLSTYRHRFRGYLRFEGLLHLIFLDETYPQSLNYSVMAIQKNLDMLPQLTAGPKMREDQKKILKVFTNLRLLEIEELNKEDENGYRAFFDDSLSSSYDDLMGVSNSLINTYFSHLLYEPQRSVFVFEADV